MENIIQIKGKVKYQITLDPGVWIFDDRKFDLLTHSFGNSPLPDSHEEYTKAISKQWDREISEGSIQPPTVRTERKFEKERIMTGTFAIPFKPFLIHSSPDPDSKSLIIQGLNEETEISIEDANHLILAFSSAGKPLKADGPVHVYYGDGRNKDNPLRNIRGFLVK